MDFQIGRWTNCTSFHMFFLQKIVLNVFLYPLRKRLLQKEFQLLWSVSLRFSQIASDGLDERDLGEIVSSLAGGLRFFLRRTWYLQPADTFASIREMIIATTTTNLTWFHGILLFRIPLFEQWFSMMISFLMVSMPKTRQQNKPLTRASHLQPLAAIPAARAGVHPQ